MSADDPRAAARSARAGDARMSGLERGHPLWFEVDGERVEACEGESIAAALLASGRRLTRWTQRTGEPRGYFCGMGVCHDCLVAVDGRPNVRACTTPVREGMRVELRREPAGGGGGG